MSLSFLPEKNSGVLMVAREADTEISLKDCDEDAWATGHVFRWT